MVLEKTLESPLDCKEIQPVHPKGNQSRVFIGRTDAEAEAPILWPPNVKNWLIGKDPDAGQDWGRGRGDNRGWDSWMASLTEWTWVWASFWNWWWTGKPGVLQPMGSQRVEHDWATEQQQANHNRKRLHGHITNWKLSDGEAALHKLKILSWQEDCTPQCLLRQRTGCRPAPRDMPLFSS